jgi:hypothetical protein
MDTEIRMLFQCLDEEVFGLFYRWKIFQQLFGSGKENLNLLNQSGSNVFALLQGLIIENTLLTLCRLTDSERTGRHWNLSIRYLLGKMETALDDKARENIGGQLIRLEAATEKLRSHRSKRIAHLDLDHAVKPEELPSVEYGDLENALRLLESIMQDLYQVVWNASVHYRAQSIAPGCDGDHLLRILRDAHDRRSSKV